MYGNLTLCRVRANDIDDFSRYGDLIVIRESYDTDVVYNLTSGQTYTRGNEQVREIGKEFLSNSEKVNALSFGLIQFAF